MQKLSLYFILISMLYSGGLLLYRATLSPGDLIEINSKILSKKIEIISSKKSSSRYGLTLQLANYSDKIGIYLGTKNQTSDNKLFTKLDTNNIYTFRIDPSVSASNRINLGLREISLNGITIYKESNKFNLFGGIFFILLGLTGLFITTKYKKKKNARK